MSITNDSLDSPVARRDQLREHTLSRRREIVAALEAERGTKVISLIHRRELWQENTRSEEADHLTVEDSEFVLMQIRATPPNQPIDLVIHTPGGLALAAEMLSDQTLLLAEIARLSLASVQRFIMWLLSDRLPQPAAAQTAEFLTGGYLAHDTPIMLDAARNLGLPVSARVPKQVYELFETCAFGMCKRPCLATYGIVHQ